MKFETKFVSPKMAEAFLTTNPINRNVSLDVVLKFAAEMNAGKWEMNGEPIIISNTGRLLDGQHRLHAIMQHGKPVEMLIVTGVADSAFVTINTGRSRSAADVLSMKGEPNSVQLSAGAAMIWRLYHYTQLRTPVPTPYIMEVVRRYSSLGKWAGLVNSAAGRTVINGASMMAALVYLEEIAKKPMAAQNFFDKMVNGNDLKSGAPCLALRNRIMTLRAAGGIVNVTTAWSATCRTISAIEDGEDVVRLPLKVNQGLIARPKYWEEHMKTLDKKLRLDDLVPARLVGGEARKGFCDLVVEMRATAEDQIKRVS